MRPRGPHVYRHPPAKILLDEVRDGIVDEALRLKDELEKTLKPRQTSDAPTSNFQTHPELLKAVVADYVGRKVEEEIVLDPVRFDLAGHRGITANKRDFVGKVIQALQGTAGEAETFLQNIDAAVARGVARHKPEQAQDVPQR
jgi:hypothetical protein